MPLNIRSLSALAFLPMLVSSHGGTSNYTVNGVWYRGYSPYDPPETQDGQPWLIQRKWTSIDPIFDPTSTNLTCNYPGDPAPASIPIAAGDNITAVYYYWLHRTGPMIVWMARCPDEIEVTTYAGPAVLESGAHFGGCRDFNASEAQWFKIFQGGLLNGSMPEGTWYQMEFANSWDSVGEDDWTVTIPKSLKPGAYLIRHEIIALHIENKPQWYPECAHLVVSGEGTAEPGDEYLVSIPGVYKINGK
jgi:hypothetical protein